jgi:hypothetical protein
VSVVDVVDVVDVLSSIVTVDVSCADAGAVSATLGRVRSVRNWLDAIDIACAKRLKELAVEDPALLPEQVAAGAGKVSLRESVRRFGRVKTTETIPELAAALGSGEASGAHVDVVTNALRGLQPDQKQRLAERGSLLARAASEQSADEFAKTVRRHRDDVTGDGGLSGLEQQKKNRRLRTWVDPVTGMFRLSGEFDPESGLLLAARLRSRVEALFHQQIPTEAPDDPQARQEYLAALALLDLLEGKGSGKTATEVMILIDAKTLAEGEHDGTIVDVGFDLHLPVETIRRMACCAEVVVPVVVAANGVNLYLGRAQRLPNRDQRRALRVMYPTCPIPGCRVHFDKLTIHHLRWWGRDHGRTDLDCLLPLCFAHHHAVHNGELVIDIAPDRSLTITHRNGTRTSTGPPSRKRVA